MGSGEDDREQMAGPTTHMVAGGGVRGVAGGRWSGACWLRGCRCDEVTWKLEGEAAFLIGANNHLYRETMSTVQPTQ